MQPVTLLFHLILNFLLFSCSKLALANVPVADQVVIVELVVSVGGRLFLCQDDSASVRLRVHLTLQATDKIQRDQVRKDELLQLLQSAA